MFALIVCNVVREDEAVMGMQVRPMDLEDVPQVFVLEEESFDSPWQEHFFSECLEAGYCCRVVKQDGLVHAYGIMSVEPRMAHILNLCVRDGWRGQGLGRRLLQELLFLAREERVHTAMLEVRATNTAALQLYKAAGFEQVAVRKNYYSSPRGNEDGLVMLLILYSSRSGN